MPSLIRCSPASGFHFEQGGRGEQWGSTAWCSAEIFVALSSSPLYTWRLEGDRGGGCRPRGEGAEGTTIWGAAAPATANPALLYWRRRHQQEDGGDCPPPYAAKELLTREIRRSWTAMGFLSKKKRSSTRLLRRRGYLLWSSQGCYICLFSVLD